MCPTTQGSVFPCDTVSPEAECPDGEYPTVAPVVEVDEYHGECDDDEDAAPFMGFMQIVITDSPPTPAGPARPMMSVRYVPVSPDTPAPTAPP